jgi:uncharacterized protein (DUF427 family)
VNGAYFRIKAVGKKSEAAMTTITVRDATRGEIVAQGEQGHNVVLLEGGFYFEPDQVRQDHLIITKRTYTCPYKGLCQWIDLDSPHGVIQDVGWVYTSPSPKYEYIRNKIAFAFGIRPGIIVEREA